jgi:acyl-CoA dehydrogenase
MMDTVGKDKARMEISAIKVAAAELATWVIDRSIQVHGGGGLSDDFPLASMYAYARTLHIVDGADEVHKMVLARQELAKWKPAG